MWLVKRLAAVMMAAFIAANSLGVFAMAAEAGSEQPDADMAVDDVIVEEKLTSIAEDQQIRTYTLTTSADMVTIEENETPLANTVISDEDCCILHFFIMLGAFAAAVYYIHDQKNCQQREFELRRELVK